MARTRVTAKVMLPAGLLEQLDGLAEQRGVSRSALVRQAIERELKDADGGAAPRISAPQPGLQVTPQAK